MTKHLSSVNATVLAWHTHDDVQAVRVDGEDRLYVDGRHIPLTAEHHHATQQVINYCHAIGKRNKAKIRAFWASLAQGGLR